MRVPTRCAASHVQARKRSRTLRVMRETPSSTRIDADHVMEPTEKTSPPLGVEKCTISAPPSSTLVPLARSRVPGGELGVRLSVSCPDAPPGTRSCRLALPNTSPAHKPVPSNAQWLGPTPRSRGAATARPWCALAEAPAADDAGTDKCPVARVHDAVWRCRHRARRGVHHAEQRRRRFERAVHAVLVWRLLVLRAEHQRR